MSESVDWSMDRAVADMIVAGAFGSNCTLVSCKQDDRQTGKDQYASTVYFGTVTIIRDDGNCEHNQLVFKLKHRKHEMRTILKNDLQFHNETMFYERIWPHLLIHLPCGSDDRVPPLPRYFYGRNQCGDFSLQDMVVVENETPKGYRLSEQHLFMDFDHVTVALRTLAKFHGLSYRAKYKDPERFAKIIADIKDTQFSDNGEWAITDFVVKGLFSVVLDRLTERLGSDNDDCRIQRFRTEILSDTNRTMRRVLTPREPLAVVCHGDFNRNNLLFRYNDDTGKPVDALAFDMATIRYGSPVLDLSFFLFMNTDQGLRDAHWDELLEVYCTSLASSVSDIADAVPVLNRARLDTEMREYAFYGAAHVSFFSRISLEKEKRVDPSEFLDLNDSDSLRVFLSFGGDTATDMFADVIQHLMNISYNE